MSTNDPARPQSSRRAFLASGTAVIASGGVLAAPALASPPDPALAVIEAERAAWDAFGDAGIAEDEADEAVSDAGWDRRPRVLIGEFTSFVRGEAFDPIPLDERIATPIYAHDHAEIDRDCNGQMRASGADLAAVEARRARLHRELDEDAAAIAAAPEVVRHAEAERVWNEAHAAWKAAVFEMVETVPTTAAGLVGIIERFEVYTSGCMVDHEADGLTALLATVRAFVTREA